MLLHRWSIGLRIISILEFIKGGLALVAFSLVVSGHYSVRGLCEKLVERLHLDPEGKIAWFLLEVVAQLNPWALTWFAIAYMTLRFAEGYGLWRERKWGEWLAAISATIYIPVEIVELVRHPSWREVAALVGNIIIVIFLSWVIMRSRGKNGKSQRGSREIVPDAP